MDAKRHEDVGAPSIPTTFRVLFAFVVLRRAVHHDILHFRERVLATIFQRRPRFRIVFIGLTSCSLHKELHRERQP